MGTSRFAQGPLGKNEICLRSFAQRMRREIPISVEVEHPGHDRLRAALNAA